MWIHIIRKLEVEIRLTFVIAHLDFEQASAKAYDTFKIAILVW